MIKPLAAPRLGFIGVRRGLTLPQFESVARILVKCDCRGAIANVAEMLHSNDGWAGRDLLRIARWMAKAPRSTVIDSGGIAEEPPPPTLESMASWADFSIETSSVPAWNRKIVDDSDVVLACPPVMVEEFRSRTWSAVRYARQIGKPVVVVLPDGVIENGGTTYFLVVDRIGEQKLMVFLAQNPDKDGLGIRARPVVLEPICLDERIGASRPLLGRSRRNPQTYREFPSRTAMAEAGFKPAGLYRICDSWNDYHFPWRNGMHWSPEAELTNETNAERSPQTNPEPRVGLRQPSPSIV
ncbi:MAG TPA: hypothetical protein VN641_09025 [Urbifossiella sp.]|nr:hypothetical protein [Urbifossiella sp.]